jgi:benzylsuccinate CoA-transferase BbsF subunit
MFANMNTSKKSIVLNLKRDRARDIARQLVPYFDVVVDNFTAGTMDRWGLGYPELSALNGSLIQMSTCMQGQTGPHAKYPGFGNLMAALSGFYFASGYSRDEIAPPYGAYTDFIVPKFAVIALLAALDHRRRTGEGQYIDVSQYEASLHFLAPPLTDYFATGSIMLPEGNRSRRYAPHGAYRCQDDGQEERWIAIAVENDAEWRALLGLVGSKLAPAEFETHVERLGRFIDVDLYVQDLVANQSAAELARGLQMAGVSAYPVQSCIDLRVDENLDGFGFWPWLDHSECGLMPYDGLAYRFSRTPSEMTAAPGIGEHTEPVLRDVLGFNADELAELAADGTLY